MWYRISERGEKVFSKYNEYKTRIKFIDIEIEDMISLGSKSDEPIPGKVTVRNNTSVVERQAEKISDLQQEKRELERELKKVDSIIDILPDDYKKLVTLRYIQDIPVSDLCVRFNVCKSTVYKWFDDIGKYIDKYSTKFITHSE